MRECKFGIDRYRLGEEWHGLGIPIAVAQLTALQKVVIGGPACRRLGAGDGGFCSRHPAFEHRDNSRDNLVLDSEDFREVTVITICPDVTLVLASMSCAVILMREPDLRTLPSTT